MSFKSARLPHHAQCHNFGMSHAFGDYDLDGKLDLFVVGMSSTTARRLDRLGLGHVQRPDIQRMRSIMGYGNRMCLGRNKRLASASQMRSVMLKSSGPTDEPSR